MKYKPMYVQIKEVSDPDIWYRKKKGHVFEVREDENNSEMYFLTPKSLKHLKKARHLEIIIYKRDCEIVDDGSKEPFTDVAIPPEGYSPIDKLYNELDRAVRYHKKQGNLKE